MSDIVKANFQESIKVLFYGMSGIFIVLIIIFVMIKILAKLFKEK